MLRVQTGTYLLRTTGLPGASGELPIVGEGTALLAYSIHLGHVPWWLR